MTVICIVLPILVYIFIGLFSAGFMDLDPSYSSEIAIFLGVVMLWPLCYIAVVLVIVCAAPIRFGKKIGDKCRPGIEKILEKSINRE